MSGKTKGAAAPVAAGTTPGAAKNSLLMQKMPLVDLVALIFLSVLAVVCVGVGGGWRAGLHFVPATLFPGVDAEVSTSSKTMKLKGQLHQQGSYFRKMSVEEGKSWLELEQYLFLTIMFTLCFVMSNTLRRLTAVGGNELAGGGAAMKAKAKKGGGFFSQRKKKLKEAKGKENAEAEQEKTSQSQPQKGNDTTSEPAETEKEIQLRERSTRKGRKADDRVDPRVLEFEKSVETATAASSEATRPTPATPSSKTPAASTRSASDPISSSGAKQKTAFVSDAAPVESNTPVLTKSSGDAPAPKKASKSAKKKNKSTVDKGLLQDYLDEEAVDDVGTGPAVEEEDEDEDCERPSLNYMKFALSSSAGPRAVNVIAEEPAGVVGLATTTEATDEDEEFDFGAGEKQDRENVPDSPKLSVAEQRALAEKERKDRELKALEDWKLEKARLEKESKGKKAHPDVGVSSSKPSGVTPGRQTAPGGSKDQHATTPGSSFSEEQKKCMKIQKKLMQILKLERDFEYEQLDELQKEKMAQKEQLLEEFEEARKSWKVKEEEDRQQQLLLEMDKIVRELSPSFKKKKAAQELRKRQAAAGGSSVLEQAAGGGGADGENKGRRNSITKTGQSASTSKKQDQHNKSGRGRRDQSSSQAREHQHPGRRNEERSATSSNRKYGRKSQNQVNTFFDPTIKPRKNEVPKAADFPSLLNDSADLSLLLQPSEGGDMSFVDLSTAGASGGSENANATTTTSTAAAAEGGAGGTTWAARLRSATTGTNLEAEGRRDRAATVDDDEVPPPPPDDSGDDSDDPHEKKGDVLDDKRFPKKALATKEELLTASMKKKRREMRRTVSHSPPDRAGRGVYLTKFRASEPNASGYCKSSFGKSTSGKGVAKGNKGSWSKGSKVNMKGGGERDKDNQNYYGGGGKTWSGPRRGMMMPPQTSRKWAFPPDSAIDPFYVRGYNDYSFVPPPPPIAASPNATSGGAPTASPADTNSSASCGGGVQDSLQSTGPLPSGVLLEMPLVMPTGERAYDLNQSRTSTTNCGNETNETMNQSLTLNQSVLSNTSQSSAMPYNQRGGGAANSAPGANPNTTSSMNSVNPNPPRSPPNVPFAEETGAVGMNTPAVVGGGGGHQNLQSCDQYSLQQKPMPRGVMLPGTAGSMGKQPIVTTVEKTSWDVSWV
mmetsp:Transcript_11131/g.27228  ORF Transcript_11131/g.27228 Transcript_11131/m.27228 type:complete len:1170 (-) Transcript_11131:1326-4835(-)